MTPHKPDGGYAFPLDVDTGDELRGVCYGMTLRDYFAAHCPSDIANGNNYGYRIRQRWAYADAMLAERDK